MRVVPSFRLLILVSCFSCVGLRAFNVNRLNGGASIVYVDFSIPGSVLPLELMRTYNSITAVNETTGWLGAFGWGWTSPFETTLTTTPDRQVILRDGSTGNTVHFRPQVDDPKAKAVFYENFKRSYFEQLKKKKWSDAELAKLQIPDKILFRLKTDPQYRVEMAQKYGVAGTIPLNELLISSEYGYQTIQFKDNHWIRDKDGVTQVFDSEGRLTRQIDKNGFYFDFKYSVGQRAQLMEISDQDHSMSLKFSWRADRVMEVTDNRNQKAKYTYDNTGNLISSTDSTNQTYTYKYDNKRFPHLLSLIEYPVDAVAKQRVYRELRYDDNGLVVYHRDKDGFENQYVYGKGQSDPESNFWTKSIKKSKTGTEEQFEEFFVKARADGSKYLYKEVNRINGGETTTVYTACCGKPQQIVKNGEITNYKYNENGLLIEKTGKSDDIRIEYDPRWKKVSKVNQNGFISSYEYDTRGNLVRASNTRGERVALKYDKGGRILEMTDPEGRQIDFKYSDTGKPIVIAEKGVGMVRIEYAPDGRIRKTETQVEKGGRRPSQAKSQEVIKRVMKSFQNLLDIIRPAGVTMVAG